MLREGIWALFQGRSQLKLQIWPRKTPRDKELCSCVAECRACPSSEVRISSSGLRNPAGDWVKSLRGQEATRPENRLRRGAIQRGRRAKPSQTEPRTTKPEPAKRVNRVGTTKNPSAHSHRRGGRLPAPFKTLRLGCPDVSCIIRISSSTHHKYIATILSIHSIAIERAGALKPETRNVKPCTRAWLLLAAVMHTRAIPFLEPLPWDVTCKSVPNKERSTGDISSGQSSKQCQNMEG